MKRDTRPKNITDLVWRDLQTDLDIDLMKSNGRATYFEQIVFRLEYLRAVAPFIADPNRNPENSFLSNNTDFPGAKTYFIDRKPQEFIEAYEGSRFYPEEIPADVMQIIKDQIAKKMMLDSYLLLFLIRLQPIFFSLFQIRKLDIIRRQAVFLSLSCLKNLSTPYLLPIFNQYSFTKQLAIVFASAIIYLTKESLRVSFFDHAPLVETEATCPVNIKFASLASTTVKLALLCALNLPLILCLQLVAGTAILRFIKNIEHNNPNFCEELVHHVYCFSEKCEQVTDTLASAQENIPRLFSQTMNAAQGYASALIKKMMAYSPVFVCFIGMIASFMTSIALGIYFFDKNYAPKGTALYFNVGSGIEPQNGLDILSCSFSLDPSTTITQLAVLLMLNISMAAFMLLGIFTLVSKILEKNPELLEKIEGRFDRFSESYDQVTDSLISAYERLPRLFSCNKETDNERKPGPIALKDSFM